MHRRYNVLLLILLAVATIASGCMTPDEESAEMQPAPLTTATTPGEMQAAGGQLPAPTPPVPTRGEEVPRSLGFVDPATPASQPDTHANDDETARRCPCLREDG